jgi:hypothetical protein
MPTPHPTPIYRFIHVENLPICLDRGGIYAPNFEPENGLIYKTIHNLEIQHHRLVTPIPCGPCGVIHDYVPFYFGYLSPMLLQLHTNRVAGYKGGQGPIIYLESTAQTVEESTAGFVFSDGHGIARYTEWFDNLAHLDKVDWDMVYERYWKDTMEDMDRQRRKQAEFLVHRFCDWSLIQEISVMDVGMKERVEGILNTYPPEMSRNVKVRRDWYYY